MIAKLCAILAVVLVIIVKELKDDEMRIRKIMESLDKAWEKDAGLHEKEQTKNGNTN